MVAQRAIDATRLLIGLGVSTDWSFEADFLSRTTGASLILVDGSVSADEFEAESLSAMRRAQQAQRSGDDSAERASRARAAQYALLARSFREFLAPSDRHFVRAMLDAHPESGAITWHSLERRIRATVGESRLDGWFVKMDIEGAEYRVLPHVLERAEQIAGMAIEFHECGVRWDELRGLLQSMRVEFRLVHVHGNNFAPLVHGTDVPSVMELTFVHRRLDDVSSLSPSTRQYPVPDLDMPNDATKPDYPLRFTRSG